MYSSIPDTIRRATIVSKNPPAKEVHTKKWKGRIGAKNFGKGMGRGATCCFSEWPRNLSSGNVLVRVTTKMDFNA